MNTSMDKVDFSLTHRLSQDTDLFCSWRNNKQAKCPIVKWSGIQNVLEETESDILIFLDCCASGVASTKY
jgi:hypothetical protein